MTLRFKKCSRLRRSIRRTLCALFTLTQSGSLVAATLPDILESNLLQVGVINSPVGDTIGRTGYQGENIALAKGFADYLGVSLNVRHFYHYDELQDALAEGLIDVAAPLSVPYILPPAYTTGPVFQQRTQRVIGQPESASDCHEDHSALPAAPVESIVKKVAARSVPCAVLPEQWLKQLQLHTHQPLETKPVPATLPHQWTLMANTQLLRAALFDFTHRSRVNHSLTLALSLPAATQRLNGPLPTRQFIDDSQPHLELLKNTFSFSGQTFPWYLLAAIHYADRQLAIGDKSASTTPPAPFRMPLSMTTPLALERPFSQQALVQALDAYLSEISRKLPARLRSPDKQLVMLAAYVLGQEHMQDAIYLTQQNGAEPFLWANIKQQTTLLATPDSYQKTRYGYANGPLAVRYVDWVMHFSDTLQLLEEQNK